MKLHHIGILASGGMFGSGLGWLLQMVGATKIAAGRVPEFECDCDLYMVGGGVKLEVVKPTGGALLERANERGTYIHHLAFEVDDGFPTLGDWVDSEGGMIPFSTGIVNGISGMRVIFSDAKFFGVNVEFVKVMK